jgi:CPA1 family monovalent cation:H+ antiporter
MLVLVSLIQALARRLFVSDAVLLALLGIAIGSASAYVLSHAESGPLSGMAAIFAHFPVNSELFLLVFLPPLVFHGALSIDVRRLVRDVAPVLLLAVVAVVATTAAIGYALQPISGQPLVVCLMLGAIVATTDPSAVIGVFRDIGADARLTRLVEGEALLNDATAIALFSVLLEQATHPTKLDFSGIGLTLAALFLGGAAVGHVLARLALRLLPMLNGSRSAEVTLTVALPYISYIVCDHFLGFSGVVAAVAAGLTVSAIGPSVLRPPSWAYLHDVWAQAASLATSLLFVLASMLVPRLLLGIRQWDLLLIGVAIVAALLARAAVLFLVMPLLRYTRLAQRISLPFKLTLLWGGLRGSLTLALALAVTENQDIPDSIEQFIATLFTLLVNGTTLRWLVRRLRLDQLSRIDQALRHQVLAIQLARVRDELGTLAHDFNFLPGPTQSALELYDELAEAESLANTFDSALSDKDRVKLGLLTFVAQERTILLTIFRERGVSFRIMENLLRAADTMIDATRVDGRLGYLRAARRRLRPGLAYRLAIGLHCYFNIDWPLTRILELSFEYLLVMRLVFLAQLRFMHERMTPVLGPRVTEVLGEIVQRRRALLDDTMGALSRLYPTHMEALENAMLRQIGLRLEMNGYNALRDEGLLSDELFVELQRDVDARREAIPHVRLSSLQAALQRRLHELPAFSTMPEEKLANIARGMTMRFIAPGERIMRHARPARAVYVLSSGEVEIEQGGKQWRLGPGELFGGDSSLPGVVTAEQVTAIRFCHLLVLNQHCVAAAAGDANATNRAPMEGAVS